jgi:hypothetical protein
LLLEFLEFILRIASGGAAMKIIAVLLISLVLGGSAHASKRQRYIREIQAIAKANQKRIHRYEQNPPPGVTPDQAGAYDSLVELDLYLLYREIHLYEHSATSKSRVEAKLAQLSRDVENSPEGRHETAQKGSALRNSH